MRYALGDIDRVLALSSDPLLRFQKLTLSPTDGFVLSRIDGVDERARDPADDPAAGRGDAEEPVRPALDRRHRVRARGSGASATRPRRPIPPATPARAPTAAAAGAARRARRRQPPPPPRRRHAALAARRAGAAAAAGSRRLAPAAPARPLDQKAEERRRRDPWRRGKASRRATTSRCSASSRDGERDRGEGSLLPARQALPSRRPPRRLARRPARQARGRVHPAGRGLRHAARPEAPRRVRGAPRPLQVAPRAAALGRSGPGDGPAAEPEPPPPRDLEEEARLAEDVAAQGGEAAGAREGPGAGEAGRARAPAAHLRRDPAARARRCDVRAGQVAPARPAPARARLLEEPQVGASAPRSCCSTRAARTRRPRSRGRCSAPSTPRAGCARGRSACTRRRSS